MALTQISTGGVKDDAITAGKIPANAVGSSEIANNAVEGNHIGNGEIAAGKLASNSVTSAKIADDSVDSEHIAAGAVDLEHMSSESVDEDNLKISNAGTNGQFLQKQSGNTGGLTWADAASEGTDIKSTGESGTAKFLRVDGDGTCSWQVPPDNNTVYTHPNHSGEVTSNADGAQTIASDVVDEDNLKISNAGTNGQFLQKQSGNTGGLTWADAGGGEWTKLNSGTYSGTNSFVELFTDLATYTSYTRFKVTYYFTSVDGEDLFLQVYKSDDAWKDSDYKLRVNQYGIGSSHNFYNYDSRANWLLSDDTRCKEHEGFFEVFKPASSYAMVRGECYSRFGTAGTDDNVFVFHHGWHHGDTNTIKGFRFHKSNSSTKTLEWQLWGQN